MESVNYTPFDIYSWPLRIYFLFPHNVQRTAGWKTNNHCVLSSCCVYSTYVWCASAVWVPQYLYFIFSGCLCVFVSSTLAQKALTPGFGTKDRLEPDWGEEWGVPTRLGLHGGPKGQRCGHTVRTQARIGGAWPSLWKERMFAYSLWRE